MSFYKIFDVSGSALQAQSIRLNTVASNMANANSIAGSEEQAYRSRQPVFETYMIDSLAATKPVEAAAGMGVQVRQIVQSDAPIRKEYHPGHPLADDQGYIFFSNVNAIEEMANMISASRSYQMSVEVVNTTKQLLIQTLNMGQNL